MLRLDKAIKPWKESASLNDHINLYGFWNETAFLTTLRCQLPTTDLGEPFPDQKKYPGLGLGPGGMFLKASATSGGSGT